MKKINLFISCFVLLIFLATNIQYYKGNLISLEYILLVYSFILTTISFKSDKKSYIICTLCSNTLIFLITFLNFQIIDIDCESIYPRIYLLLNNRTEIFLNFYILNYNAINFVLFIEHILLLILFFLQLIVGPFLAHSNSNKK